ncbi:MAG: aminotransferase class III-fold pyridoxal phosphate-dependent enzyme [Actinomycetota bacterium]
MTVTDADLDHLVAEAHSRYRATRPRSAEIDQRARGVMPGGNTRSVLDFAPFPFRVERAQGAELVDLDGHRYVDLCGNYTAGLLGHSPARVREAVAEALEQGWAIGATHPREVELAELIVDRFPSIEQVRFTNSGTEANLMAVGTAVHVTGRSGVLVFDRGYHGGVLSFGPRTDGPHHPLNVPHDFRVGRFDDLDDATAHLETGELACVLVEAVQGSGGCRPASVEFLHGLRERCDATGTLLILDEVMTSRLAPGGAQERFGVLPDLTTLGKYLGGGMTFGAFGGRREVLEAFDPSVGGALSQAGTFNNNVASMAAAIATLRHELSDDRVRAVNERGDRLRVRLDEVLSASPLLMWVTGLGSMLCVHTDDDRLLDLWFHAMVEQGLFPARRGFMALSMEVSDADCDRLVAATSAWVSGVPE